jgi:disulfide bond formation protein DsbB
MSRRDMVVNTLLGLLLISALGLPLLLGFAVLKGASLVITSFWPQLAHHQDALLLGFMALGALTAAIQQSRKRRWRSALLSFAALPMILSICFAGAHSSFGLNGAFWIAGFFPVFFLPPDSAPTRFQFFAAAAAISAVVAVNTGLLGSGLIARIVSDCVLAGLFIWSAMWARELSSGPKDPGPQAPLSPTNA